ncbi:DUF397 domain-containing protein [Streptomyces sp. NPDC019990]|uniref:DUF397 domain-containing protein n=1 Tax=Streptomyces sp. NPDC019990 TaxID=3154693 RepID=UPI0033C18BE0
MSDRLIWFKSSYSDSEGSNCLEVALERCKSSHSDSPAPCPHAVHVRDSKLAPRSPRFAVAGAAWAAFVAYARTGA